MSCRKANRDLVWIVVYVFRGFPECVRVFKKETLALKYADRIRRMMNRDYDEVGVFEVEI